MNASLNKAFEFIDKNRDKIVSDLCALSAIPSISIEGKDSFPYSKEVNDVLLKARELYCAHGFDLEVKSESGYAVFVSDGEGDGIGLFGHADVVPVNDDWVKTAPFSPIEENGILYGRGVSDNKAGVIGSLYALAALKEAGIFPKSRITSYICGSEETGMPDILSFVENEKMPYISIIPDSDFPVSLGEKGIMHIDVKSKVPFESISKFEGGRAYNVVLDRVDVTLNGDELVFKGIT